MKKCDLSVRELVREYLVGGISARSLAEKYGYSSDWVGFCLRRERAYVAQYFHFGYVGASVDMVWLICHAQSMLRLQARGVEVLEVYERVWKCCDLGVSTWPLRERIKWSAERRAERYRWLTF